MEDKMDGSAPKQTVPGLIEEMLIKINGQIDKLEKKLLFVLDNTPANKAETKPAEVLKSALLQEMNRVKERLSDLNENIIV